MRMRVESKAGEDAFMGTVLHYIVKDNEVTGVAVLSPAEARDIAAKLIEAANRAEDDDRISQAMGTWEA